jgi:hypothetical protein
MTENLLPEDVLAQLDPAAVTPAVIFMASEGAPTKQIIAAGAGVFARVAIQETPGIYLAEDQRNAETIAAQWEQIAATKDAVELNAGSDQTVKFLTRAAKALGIEFS